jgi:PIN domain nuclease of toxin-antitoxin system
MIQVNIHEAKTNLRSASSMPGLHRDPFDRFGIQRLW